MSFSLFSTSGMNFWTFSITAILKKNVLWLLRKLPWKKFTTVCFFTGFIGELPESIRSFLIKKLDGSAETGKPGLDICCY